MVQQGKQCGVTHTNNNLHAKHQLGWQYSTARPCWPMQPDPLTRVWGRIEATRRSAAGQQQVQASQKVLSEIEVTGQCLSTLITALGKVVLPGATNCTHQRKQGEMTSSLNKADCKNYLSLRLIVAALNWGTSAVPPCHRRRGRQQSALVAGLLDHPARMLRGTVIATACAPTDDWKVLPGSSHGTRKPVAARPTAGSRIGIHQAIMGTALESCQR